MGWVIDIPLPFTRVEMPFLVGAISAIMVVHRSLASDAVELLAAIGTLDPKIGFQLLLLVLFYCNIFSRKEVERQDMVVSFLFALRSDLIFSMWCMWYFKLHCILS